MESKKGVFEIQFNWIFVLAVGALILLFFSVIVLRQKGISEISTSDLILKNLEAILSGAEVSRGTVNLVDIPKTEIEFECSRYRIGKISKQFEVMSIFAPRNLETTKLITWTLEWSLPYRFTNSLYVTSPETRYIIVGNSNFARKVFNSLPNETQKDIYNNANEIVDKDDDKVRVVFFGNNAQIPGVFSSMPKGTVTALKISGDESKGELNFFDFENSQLSNKGTSYYIRLPALLGAIFADDIGTYECAMKNSFKKLNVITQVYNKKTNDMKAYYESRQDQCSQYHDDSQISLILSASNAFSLPNINGIDSASRNLEQQNNQAQLFSCALIY